MSRARVVIELASDAQSARALAAGGVFVPGCELRLAEECDLVVRGATQQIVIPARVVYVDDQQRGAGLELIGFTSELKDQLALLEPAAIVDQADLDDPALELDLIDPESVALDDDFFDVLDHVQAEQPLATGTQDPNQPRRRSAHERLRGLPFAAQLKLASTGELHERILLERLYGKNVWETLLRNPRLSPPEVSRIARYGTLPRPLLEIILANNAWLQVPEVRRALLSNPRLGADQIMKVLRLTPRHELKLAAVQTAYPHAVRNAAKTMLRSGE